MVLFAAKPRLPQDVGIATALTPSMALLGRGIMQSLNMRSYKLNFEVEDRR